MSVFSSITGAADPAAGTLGVGAANLGNLFRAVDDEQAWTICEEAWEAGMRYFDTAPHYGLGLSERRLGAFLQTKPREEYVLSTKVGRLLDPIPNPDGALDLANDFHVPADYTRTQDYTADGIERSITDSLTRLGLDQIDILFLHDPDRADIGLDAALETALPALEAARAAGLARGIGIGAMTAETFETGLARADLDVLMIAGRYTLLEQPAAKALDDCASRGVEAVIASVFNSGLLATTTPARTDRYEYGQVPTELFDKTVAIAGICADHGVELPAAALQYPMLHPAVSSVVVGLGRSGQAAQNVERAHAPIPAALWTDLEAAGLIPALAPPKGTLR